jgi:hypothetical protein
MIIGRLSSLQNSNCSDANVIKKLSELTIRNILTPSVIMVDVHDHVLSPFINRSNIVYEKKRFPIISLSSYKENFHMQIIKHVTQLMKFYF